ncbi:MAG: GNAT family protein [Bacteroidota bacterium]
MHLTTTRLYIRPVTSSDKEALFSYRSDLETSQYLSFIPSSEDDMEGFIKKSARELNISGTWFQVVLIEQTSNTLIGDIGIHFLDDGSHKQVELGCTLDKEFRGKGYVAEALSTIISFLFDHLEKHRIIASIDPSNVSSIKLFERLGFRKEAHFRKSLFLHGKWVDDVVYAILSEEWKGNA